MIRRTAVRVARGVAVATAAALLVAGCSSSSETSGGTSGASTGSSAAGSGASSGGAAPSKDVIIGYGAVGVLDPIVFKSNTGFMITNNIYGTLVSQEYTEQDGLLVGDATYQPELAESLEWDAAGTLLTITLKPGLTFQDGTPLTAEDVVYTLQRSLSPESYANAFKVYIGIEDETTDITAVDDTTLTIATQFEAPLMEKFLSFPIFGILPKAVGEANKTADDPWATAYFSKNNVSSGPYVVESWPGDAEIVLAKNPAYTASDTSAAPETVTVKNVSDPNQQYLALQQGQLDLAMGLTPKLAKQAESDAAVKVTASSASQLAYLGFNNADPVLKDVRVRQAISYLVPYDTLRTEVMQGFANDAYGPAPYPMASSLDPDGTKVAYPTDVAKAKALLAEAGVSDLTLTLSVNAADPTSVESATFIQSALQEGGVTLNVEQLQSSEYTQKLGEKQLQMFLGEWYSWGQDAVYQMFFLLSSGSFVNYTGFDNAEIDSTLTEAISEADVATRDGLSQTAQQIAIDEAPMAYLYARNYLVVSNPNVSGITQPDDALPYFRYLSVQ
ncbi:hypothetical protein GIS00_16200 [Nakamurella sp. YIM 132087]|uniref:Solute-binding protein family 5 domain-containing protein n=1 Tax=Nakamurella alba TaxID=2665158 RepID=A0A7K1FMX9_9ACTN|nr:ABC transporter substrate-binding protein [Nakamurella alba]MTD15478.1 hypothetical protein [Nakamurella alba]